VAAVRRVVEEEWATDLVRGWDRWLDLGLRVGDTLAPLIGASAGEVALCDQTGVNLFKLVSAAMDATGRSDIVTDAGNFPSDRYILDAIAAARGGRLRLIEEDPDAPQVEAALDDRVGVVALTHVSYRSGAILDMAGITSVVEAAGALPVWDLAHSAGSVPVDLSASGVVLAAGCTYKYLNGGPGAPAFLYVSRALQSSLRQPISGWFGHLDQFAFSPTFDPAPDIRRFLVGTPPILAMVAAAEGIALTAGVGIGPIREKSVDPVAEIASPRDPRRRGSHVTVRHARGWQISQALRRRGVIIDFRAPDLIRFGFAPLYNSYRDVWRAADTLRDVVRSGEYAAFPHERGTVT
jgi:kynureninase